MLANWRHWGKANRKPSYVEFLKFLNLYPISKSNIHVYPCYIPEQYYSLEICLKQQDFIFRTTRLSIWFKTLSAYARLTSFLKLPCQNQCFFQDLWPNVNQQDVRDLGWGLRSLTSKVNTFRQAHGYRSCPDQPDAAPDKVSSPGGRWKQLVELNGLKSQKTFQGLQLHEY